MLVFVGIFPVAICDAGPVREEAAKPKAKIFVATQESLSSACEGRFAAAIEPQTCE